MVGDEPLITKFQQALELSTALHKFQRDAAGADYILHPLRVMFAVRERGGDEDAQCAALLHDVVEDCAYPVANLERIFGPRVAQMVQTLTRQGDPNSETEETYPNFIARILASTRDTIIIKECDIRDNYERLDPMWELDPPKAARLKLKYERALLAIRIHGYTGDSEKNDAGY